MATNNSIFESKEMDVLFKNKKEEEYEYKGHPRDAKLLEAVKNLNYDNVSQLLINDPVNKPTNVERINALRLILVVFSRGNDTVETQHEIIKIQTLLLNTKANVDITDFSGRTALHWAVANRMSLVVEFLISREANLKACNRYGNNLLHHLIETEVLRLHLYDNVQDFLKKQTFMKRSMVFIEWIVCKIPGVVDFTNKRHETPLHLAAKLNLLYAIPILVKYTTFVQIFDCLGMTAFQVFVETAVCEKNQDFFMNGSVRLPLNNYYQPAYVEHVCVKFLEKGFSVDVPDIRNTPLHYALMFRKRNFAKLMLPYLNNVDARNEIGNTELNIIMHYNKHEADDEDIVRFLLAKGANVHNLNNRSFSPIIAAVHRRKFKMLKIFKEYGAEFSRLFITGNLLHYFLKSETPTDMDTYIAIFNLLINEGCDVNTKDSKGITPLHFACKYGKLEMVERLIHLGADVNSRDYSHGFTPLHVAVKFHNTKLLEVLTRNGADVNATNNEGQTALHFCIEHTIKELIELGACMHIADKKGFLPLHVAIKKKNIPAFQELLKYGADINDSVDVLTMDILLAFKDVVIYLIKSKAADLHMDILLKNCLRKSKKDFKEMTSKKNSEEIISKNESQEIYNNCRKEIKSLKKFMITDGVSLYNFLHLHRDSACKYVDDGKLIKLFDRLSDFKMKYPMYHSMILSTHYMAFERRNIYEPSKDAFCYLTNARLPDLCIHAIFSNLCNEDLKSMIGSVKYMDDGVNEISRSIRYYGTRNI